MTEKLYRLGGAAAAHPWRTFALWLVVVAVAVGTPGIGYVNTGLLLTHATDVFPIVMTSPASRCGLGVIDGGSDVPANAALNAPCGPDHRRIIRSSTVAGIGVALPLPGISSAP